MLALHIITCTKASIQSRYIFLDFMSLMLFSFIFLKALNPTSKLAYLNNRFMVFIHHYIYILKEYEHSSINQVSVATCFFFRLSSPRKDIKT